MVRRTVQSAVSVPVASDRLGFEATSFNARDEVIDASSSVFLSVSISDYKESFIRLRACA